ncbi:MAG: zf-TFIIB domain-containing protein [candidate division Zixibacteria bacterium]|nr:zf-TFIIB domain-containing protein [candidate division Zixibacteria bacterium]
MSEIVCPKCSGPMSNLGISDLSVKQCHRCSGTWLELAEIKSQLDKSTQLWAVLEKGGVATGLPCPTCRYQHLSRAKYGNSEIDWCSACKGMFFDPGELEQIDHLYNEVTRPTRREPSGPVLIWWWTVSDR